MEKGNCVFQLNSPESMAKWLQEQPQNRRRAYEEWIKKYNWRNEEFAEELERLLGEKNK